MGSVGKFDLPENDLGVTPLTAIRLDDETQKWWRGEGPFLGSKDDGNDA